MAKQCNRRTFLDGTIKGVGAAAALAVAPRLARGQAAPGAPAPPAEPEPAPPAASPAAKAPAPGWLKVPGKVIQVRNPAAMKSMRKPNAEVVAGMVDEAVKRLAGESDLKAAWSRFVSADDKVEIKVNCLGKRYNSTNQETVQAIMAGLELVGIPKDHIFIYDMYGGHLRLSRQPLFRPDGKRVGFADQWGYERKPITHGAGKSKLAKILGRVTAVINVPVMKTHSLCKITGALKNMTHGHVHNPSRFHKGGCVPGIPEIYSLPEVGGKVRLSIMDGLRLLYHGGPQDSPKHRIVHNTIYAATDPVALDTILLERIQAARKEGKKRALATPVHLAAAAKAGLGEADRAKIVLEEVNQA